MIYHGFHNGSLFSGKNESEGNIQMYEYLFLFPPSDFWDCWLVSCGALWLALVLKYKIFSIFCYLSAPALAQTTLSTTYHRTFTIYFFLRPGMSGKNTRPFAKSFAWFGLCFIFWFYFLNFKAKLKLCWQKYIIPKYFSFIPLLLPPTNNSAPLWCMVGGGCSGRGGGSFLELWTFSFFIHCTGVCLYRILIAKKKQFLVSTVKITFLMKKFLFYEINSFWCVRI